MLQEFPLNLELHSVGDNQGIHHPYVYAVMIASGDRVEGSCMLNSHIKPHIRLQATLSYH